MDKFYDEFLSVPVALTNFYPKEMAVYLALRYVGEYEQNQRQSLEYLARIAKVSTEVFAICVINLRLSGMVLIDCELNAIQLIKEIDQVPINLTDQQFSLHETLQYNPSFFEFVRSILEQESSLMEWLDGIGIDDERYFYFDRTKCLAQTVIKYAETQTA